MCDELETWDRTTLHLEADGSLTGRRSTNDDEDRGYPTTTAAWPVMFKNVNELTERYPHASPWTGTAGCRCEVIIDGQHWKGKER